MDGDEPQPEPEDIVLEARAERLKSLPRGIGASCRGVHLVAEFAKLVLDSHDVPMPLGHDVISSGSRVPSRPAGPLRARNTAGRPRSRAWTAFRKAPPFSRIASGSLARSCRSSAH